jgi:4-hydroxybenzoate polyprenyltransferase
LAFSSTTRRHNGLSRIKLFLALSRTTHGLLDMAAPAFAALLWLGAFPEPEIVILGLLTTFAGYTAVYALNDVVGYRQDKEKIEKSLLLNRNDLDAVWVRHPMAQELLSFRAGLTWAVGWSAVAAVGAFMLNPVCLLIFLAGCCLEAVYCLLLKITHHRVIISGGVKTSGAIAAVFAVDPNPDIRFLVFLFLLFFFWEIGGQNVPNDWSDIEEDRKLNARTVPIRFGPDRSLIIILVSLFITLGLTAAIFSFSQAAYQWPFVLLALIAAGILLIRPAWHLFRHREATNAMFLFNRASLFPLSLLIVVLIKVIGDSVQGAPI